MPEETLEPTLELNRTWFAEMLKCHPSTINRGVREMVARGYLAPISTRGVNGSYRHTVYRLTLVGGDGNHGAPSR